MQAITAARRRIVVVRRLAMTGEIAGTRHAGVRPRRRASAGAEKERAAGATEGGCARPAALFFLLTCFVAPIGAMLARGVTDDRYPAHPAAGICGTRALGRSRTAPEAAYSALIADIRAARDAGTLASAATRLNYDVAGIPVADVRDGSSVARRT